MRTKGEFGRLGGLLVVGVAAAEVIIMSSPFAGFFYSSFGFQRIQGFLSERAATAWLNSFFLNSSAVTTSRVLEWHRELGVFLIALGLWGFLVSAAQVYGNKLLRRGVARGLLYRVSRHPQYLCLAIAGYGMVVVWPRFLLLGLWVTMLFLYAGLARFEEARMAERFGREYDDFSESRSSFLPGSPVRRLFEASFGKLRPRALGWVAAYVSTLALAFGAAFLLRELTLRQLSVHEVPEQDMLVLSVWPADTEWLESVAAPFPYHEHLQRVLKVRDGRPLFVTVMPHDYNLQASYYRQHRDEASWAHIEGLNWTNLKRLATVFLVPIQGNTWGKRPYMGHRPPPGSSVRVVWAMAEKPYRNGLRRDEVLDVGVRMLPIAVGDMHPETGRVTRVERTMQQNAWGRDVVMPMF